MMLRFILFALAIYFIYKVVFELVIPIFKTTQKIRQQFSAMQDQMNTSQHGNATQSKPPVTQTKTTRGGDYIDFEEVK